MAMRVGWTPLDTLMRTPTALRALSVVVFFLLFLCISTAEGRSTHCRVNECTQSYNQAITRLKAAEKRSPEDDLSNRRCQVQKRLHRCLHRTKRACRGNLLFHSFQHMSDTTLKTANCSSHQNTQLPNVNLRPTATSPDSKILVENATLLPSSLGPSTTIKGDECSFVEEPIYKHCGMFGDPHLRTFSDRFYTCSVERAWPLIDNDYMVVMATNVPVREGLEATVTTKITVLIKSAGKCADLRHYVATSDGLPGAFSDGSSVTGSVYVVEIDEGKHVEIQARFIATTVIIRRVAGYLTFAIRIPEVLVSAVTSRPQLCVHGCPLEHRIAPIKQMKQDKAISPSNTPKLPSLSNQTQAEGKARIKSHTKRAYDDTNLPSNTNAVISGNLIAEISEEDARKLCKRIILGKTEDVTNEDDQMAPESRQKNTNSSKTPKSISSISSVAFSSLIPSSSRKNKRRGRRKHRMAPASKSNADVSRTSFHRLLSTQDENDDAILSTQNSRKRKRKRKKKSKRDVSNQIEQSVEDIQDPDCVETSNNDEFTDFNFYFDSCVFDLITTGDVNFTFSAKAALQDLTQTHVLAMDAPGASLSVVKCWKPNNIRTINPNIVADEKPNGGENGASPKSISIVVIFLCAMFTCFYVNFLSILHISSNITVDKPLQKRFDKQSCKPNQRTETFSNASLRP